MKVYNFIFMNNNQNDTKGLFRVPYGPLTTGVGGGVKHDALNYLEGSLQLLLYKIFMHLE